MSQEILVIHPADPSTNFLKPIYEHINATVVTGGVSRPDLHRLVEKADRVILLGHGSPWGLFSVGQFPEDLYVVDASFAGQLRERPGIYVWCFASDFVRNHKLSGFATGMFISEPLEAAWCRVPATETEIDQSNWAFSHAVGPYARQPAIDLLTAVNDEYGRLAKENGVIAYNHQRIEVFNRMQEGV